MIRLSIQARQALARLTLPVLVLLSLAVMLVGRADNNLAEQARMSLGNALTPIYGAFAGPESALQGFADRLRDVSGLEAENTRLRDENLRLRRWYNVAMALSSENAGLKRELHWVPDAAPTYVTARVVADAGGLYARAVTLALSPGSGVHKGEIALGADGLVGRVTEVAPRSALVLLITDLNSRIPVQLERSGARAIMAGTNGPMPHLLYVAGGVHPQAGERVVTSSETGALPAGLPVGIVSIGANGSAEVAPYARLDSLQLLRVFDYGTSSPLLPAGAADPSMAPAAATTVRPPATTRGIAVGVLDALTGRGRARQAR